GPKADQEPGGAAGLHGADSLLALAVGPLRPVEDVDDLALDLEDAPAPLVAVDEVSRVGRLLPAEVTRVVNPESGRAAQDRVHPALEEVGAHVRRPRTRSARARNAIAATIGTTALPAIRSRSIRAATP